MAKGLEAALVAREIATESGFDEVCKESAFTSAVLHDVGRLVLLEYDPQKFASSIRLAEENGLSASDAEREVFGVDHSAVGAHLLRIWGLPHDMVEVVAFHERPWLSNAADISVLTAVAAGNLLTKSGFSPENLPEDSDFGQYFRNVGCFDKLSKWFERYVKTEQQDEA